MLLIHNLEEREKKRWGFLGKLFTKKAPVRIPRNSDGTVYKPLKYTKLPKPGKNKKTKSGESWWQQCKQLDKTAKAGIELLSEIMDCNPFN